MISIALAIAFQQSTLKDVHIAAMPLEKAIVQISSIYNSPMDVSVLLRSKTIFVEASQVTETEIRDQIAKTLNATWERKDQTWHLAKSAKQQQSDVDRGAIMRSRFLKKTLEIRKKSLEEKPGLTPESAVQIFHQLRNEEKRAQEDKNYLLPPGPSPSGYGLPNHRLLSRFLLKFGPTRIARIPNGHRVVFALHPNSMQQPMGIDISDILAKYRTEQEIWIKSAAPLVKNQEGNGDEQISRELHYQSSEQIGWGLESSFGSMPMVLKDIIFTVYCSEEGTYNFKIIGIPSFDGPNIVYEIKGTTFEGAFAGMVASDFEVKPVEGFKLSEEADDFKHFFENGQESVPAARQGQFLLKVSDPVLRDPLSFGLSEALIFDARRLKRNIVALLGDSQVNTSEPVFGDMLTQEKFKELLQDFASVDDKWIRMFDAPFAAPNLPRIELKRLISNASTDKKVSIFDRATIASYQNRNSSVSYLERLLERFAGVSGGDNNDPDALKLFGLLSQSERQVALSPNGVRFGQLNSKAQLHLFECCYYNEHNRIQFVSQNKKQPIQVVVNEPTYLAPDGIVNDATLSVREKVQDLIKESGSADRGGLQTDARGWGHSMYQNDHPEDYPGAIFTFDKKHKLSRLKETSYNFRLRLSSDCEWQSTMSSNERVGSGSFTIDSLPDDMKVEFENGYKDAATAAKLRREMLKKKDGGG